MKVTLLIWVAFLALWPSVGSATDDVLVVRYACLMGGRAAGAAPTSAGVLSRSELSDFLLAWNPGSDNEEVRTVFALNELGELARQASQLPLAGGAVSGVYTHGDSIFEIDMEIRPSGSMSREQEVMTIMAEIKGDGELISGSKIHVPLNERAIITTSTGPEAPFLFLVVEVDRLSADELMRRGLRHSWRRDYRLVDGVEVTQPAAIEQSPPSYPAEAKESRHEGRVVPAVGGQRGGQGGRRGGGRRAALRPERGGVVGSALLALRASAPSRGAGCGLLSNDRQLPAGVTRMRGESCPVGALEPTARALLHRPPSSVIRSR